MMTTHWLPPLFVYIDATEHVLIDTGVTDWMYANNDMADEGYESARPHNQTHLSSRGASRGEPEEETQSGNGVKGMFRVLSLFLPYSVRSTTIITSIVVLMCSSKGRKHRKRTLQVVPISGWQTASRHSKREDKAGVSSYCCQVCNWMQHYNQEPRACTHALEGVQGRHWAPLWLYWQSCC